MFTVELSVCVWTSAAVPHYYKVNNILFKKRKYKILLILQSSLLIIKETHECNLLDVLTQGINSKILWIITPFFQYINFFYMKQSLLYEGRRNTKGYKQYDKWSILINEFFSIISSSKKCYIDKTFICLVDN